MTTNPPTDDSELDAIWHQQTFFSPTEYSRRAMRAAFAAGGVSVTPETDKLAEIAARAVAANRQHEQDLRDRNDPAALWVPADTPEKDDDSQTPGPPRMNVHEVIATSNVPAPFPAEPTELATATTEGIARVLRENGIDEQQGSALHSWRCGRDVPCDCFETLVSELVAVAALTGTQENARALDDEERAQIWEDARHAYMDDENPFTSRPTQPQTPKGK